MSFVTVLGSHLIIWAITGTKISFVATSRRVRRPVVNCPSENYSLLNFTRRKSRHSAVTSQLAPSCWNYTALSILTACCQILHWLPDSILDTWVIPTQAITVLHSITAWLFEGTQCRHVCMFGDCFGTNHFYMWCSWTVHIRWGWMLLASHWKDYFFLKWDLGCVVDSFFIIQ